MRGGGGKKLILSAQADWRHIWVGLTTWQFYSQIRSEDSFIVLLISFAKLNRFTKAYRLYLLMESCMATGLLESSSRIWHLRLSVLTLLSNFILIEIITETWVVTLCRVSVWSTKNLVGYHLSSRISVSEWMTFNSWISSQIHRQRALTLKYFCFVFPWPEAEQLT